MNSEYLVSKTCTYEGEIAKDVWSFGIQPDDLKTHLDKLREQIGDRKVRIEITVLSE